MIRTQPVRLAPERPDAKTGLPATIVLVLALVLGCWWNQYKVPSGRGGLARTQTSQQEKTELSKPNTGFFNGCSVDSGGDREFNRLKNRVQDSSYQPMNLQLLLNLPLSSLAVMHH